MVVLDDTSADTAHPGAVTMRNRGFPMPMRRLPALILLLLASLLPAQGGPALCYTVEVKPGDTQAFHHHLEIDRPDRDEVALSVAAWAPGSYQLMNVWDGIKDVAARDGAGVERAVAKRGDLT